MFWVCFVRWFCGAGTMLIAGCSGYVALLLLLVYHTESGEQTPIFLYDIVPFYWILSEC